MKKSKFIKEKKSVSEVLGTILLLAVAVTVITIISYNVLNKEVYVEESNPTIIATVEGSNIIFEHRGGERLGFNTEITVKIAGAEDKILVKDNIKIDSNSNNKWDIGEKVEYPFVYDFSNSKAEVMVVDVQKNKIVMDGVLNIYPQSDIGLEIKVDNNNPKINSFVNITLTASHYKGDITAQNIEIYYPIPEGLKHIQNTTNTGAKYNNKTGIWTIDTLKIGQSFNLKIKVKVTAIGKIKPTQIGIAMDGSGSISGPGGNQPGPDWGYFRVGLSNAVNDSVPHTGDIELSVIQFAQNRARVEVEPIVITDTNYIKVSNKILNINQLGGWTPMSCGLQLIGDTLKNSFNNSDSGGKFDRQAIILVTDGKPTCKCIINDADPYIKDGSCSSSAGAVTNFKINTEEAAEYIINVTIPMEEGTDELNSIAVGDGPEVEWLKEEIVWPGNYTWSGGNPPKGPGWVREVANWQEFKEAINEAIILLFDSIYNQAELLNSTPKDTNTDNNNVIITIKPRN